jgi:phosphate-selective porin
VWDVFPALRLASGWAPPENHALELAGRFERFDQEVDESGLRARRERTTLGVNYVASTFIKLQVEYILRRGDDPAAVAPNLANNAFLASLQAAF